MHGPASSSAFPSRPLCLGKPHSPGYPDLHLSSPWRATSLAQRDLTFWASVVAFCYHLTLPSQELAHVLDTSDSIEHFFKHKEIELVLISMNPELPPGAGGVWFSNIGEEQNQAPVDRFQPFPCPSSEVESWRIPRSLEGDPSWGGWWRVVDHWVGLFLRLMLLWYFFLTVGTSL